MALSVMTTWVRRLLDPIGGDIVDHPHRRLRLNFRRVELVAVFEICTVLYEGIFSFHRDVPVPGLLTLCIIYGSVSLAFLLVARYGQRRDIPALHRLPEAFLVSILLIVQAGGYLFAESGRLATGYAFTYLVCAAFFLIPPRRFALIGAVTLVFYACWISALPLSLSDRIANLANTALIVGVAMLARWGLHRLEDTNERQRRENAEQNERLAEANRQLEVRNAELNNLMAIAAHDLRSPLHGLNNLLDLAAGHPPASDAAWRELLGEAGASVASMLALIGRILAAHEAEAQGPDNRASCDLVAAAGAALRRARATATRTGIALELETNPEPVPVHVDPDALDQILDNLLSNALRFSPSGSKVCIVVGRNPKPFVEVRDEGIGIPPEERGQLFGKFQRGARAPLNGSRGSGLGLYIVTTLAAANGATASYRPGNGGGSAFRVAFAHRVLSGDTLRDQD